MKPPPDYVPAHALLRGKSVLVTAAAGAGEHHHARGAVLLQPVEDPQQLADQAGVERVEPLGPVQAHLEDALLQRAADDGFHGLQWVSKFAGPK